MILDFLIINTSTIFISSILLYTISLNDNKLYYIFIIDLIINKIPIITIIIIILYIFKINLFKIFNENIYSLLILLTIYYFIFGISLYIIYNDFSIYIINYLISNLIFNLIIYIIGLKYISSKYNIIGESYGE